MDRTVCDTSVQELSPASAEGTWSILPSCADPRDQELLIERPCPEVRPKIKTLASAIGQTITVTHLTDIKLERDGPFLSPEAIIFKGTRQQYCFA